MEWLMGKARGVSKNFLSSSSSSLNAMSPSSPTSADEIATIMAKLSNENPMYMEPEYVNQFLYLPHDLSLEKLVTSPSYINRNEWIASHVIGLYENVNNVYEAINDLCNCPVQPASCSVDEKGKKVKQTPKQYLDTLMSHCYEIVESGKCFPKKCDDKFPLEFLDVVNQILRNLLQCMIHLYLSHYEDFVLLEFVPHINSIAKHFFLFTSRYNFLDEKCFEALKTLYELYLTENVATPIESLVKNETETPFE